MGDIVKQPNEEKYLYLLLYAKGKNQDHNEPILMETILHKMMYGVCTHISGVEYNFYPHYYGIYSKVLKNMVDQGISLKYIQDNSGEIMLTQTGIRIAKKLWKKLDDRTKNIIQDVKEFYSGMTHDECIAYSYSQYPNTTSKSTIMEKFNNIRLDAAISLFGKKKISAAMAASVAGLEYEEFTKEMRQRNLPIHYIDEKAYERIKKTAKSLV